MCSTASAARAEIADIKTAVAELSRLGYMLNKKGVAHLLADAFFLRGNFFFALSLFGAKYFTITVSPTIAVPLTVLNVAQARCDIFIF